MLIISEFKEEFKEDMVRVLNNRETAKWLLSPPFPYSEKDADDFLRGYKNDKNSLNRNFAIVKDGKFIGGIGLKLKSVDYAEVGFYIDELQRNKGYCSEALIKILEYGFEKLNLPAIKAEVFEGNSASERVLSKCGFRYEKESEQAVRLGVTYNTKLFKIEKAEFNRQED
ncbi:MAG TPA: GNAT family N-acetyltransferase [Ignavibacteria bacterium]|nr:hypothetical protein [Bacteroidota bacterium]HRI86134.1 GNAT family N-acetyltransferase [Ignavibacteria bacterium]HRJ98392.1 GNAT family N-acetyltransferase [Ignavibacteria bacterium]